MDLKDRIKVFADSLGLSIREFERACNLTRGNISNMTGALGSDKLSKIIDTHPQLSVYWLLMGHGSMLRADAATIPPQIASQPAPEPTIMYKSDPRDAQLIAALQTTIERDADVITALKRELQEYKDREGRPLEKGFQPQHLGGAQSVDIPRQSERDCELYFSF